MRALGTTRNTSAGNTVYDAAQHTSMPTEPMTAKSEKPRNAVAASEPYAMAAPSEATSVGRSVPAMACAMASSGSCRRRSSR
jgi:hypothetical protein